VFGMKKIAQVPLSEINVQDDYSKTLIKALKKNRKKIEIQLKSSTKPGSNSKPPAKNKVT
jgi:hypothetical protein